MLLGSTYSRVSESSTNFKRNHQRKKGRCSTRCLSQKDLAQLYSEFTPNLSDITRPLHKLEGTWKWDIEQEKSFGKLKEMLTADAALAHLEPDLGIRMSCDASESRLEAVLFHCYLDGSERPIANDTKTLTSTRKKYGQIRKQALLIMSLLKNYHQCLYGRQFILLTDHRPLLALLEFTKGVPALAAKQTSKLGSCTKADDYNRVQTYQVSSKRRCSL